MLFVRNVENEIGIRPVCYRLHGGETFKIYWQERKTQQKSVLSLFVGF